VPVGRPATRCRPSGRSVPQADRRHRSVEPGHGHRAARTCVRRRRVPP